ncbi:MAG: chitobiase/beta-hexosaminidase C-terminal domain-containing protein [Muribaculaceae bacterium]|nr:chitobiase/beta-hexosaminidase C-terminal domain-containing protein [Muribaculaceae bacterium]
MKKFLLSLAMVLGLVSYASATTISFTMDQVTLTESGEYDSSGNPIIKGFKYDNIIATINSGSNNTNVIYSNSGKDVRLYAEQTLTIETVDGSNLTNITFTISSNGKKRLADMTVNTGTCVSNGADTWTVVWNGEAPSVSITVGATSTVGTEAGKAGRLAFSAMEVTTGGAGIERSETPVISPESTTFGDDGMLVTISAAAGASIYYTLDGTTPTEASELYAAPIALTATATVKAIAIEEGKSASAVAEQTYTYRSGEFQMTSVLGTATVGSELSVGGVVTAICTRGIVVTDNSGSLFVYSSSFPYKDYAIGDQVSFTGTVGEYGTGLQFDGTAVTIEKWGNQAYTYPAPTTIDWASAVARSASERAYYTTMEGTLSISGNYYNVELGIDNVQGSIYYATDEVKEQMANGQDVKLKGYFISVSSGKYANLIVTEVVAEGDEKPATQVANIAEFIEKGLSDESTIFEITGEVAVTYQNGQNLYVQDATGEILVYGSLQNIYNNGDRLTGIQGTFKNYYSTYEFMAVSTSFGAATAGAAVEPKAYYIENIVPEIQNHYILLENVTLDIENSKFIDAIDADIKYYNKFAIEIPEAGTYDVIAVVNYYQAKGAEYPELQVYPIEFIGAEVPPTELTASTLAEALQMGANGETEAITITGDVTVVYKNNRNIYVKDDSAWTLLYNKNDVEMPAYKNGDVISGFKAIYAVNDEHGQLIPVSDFNAATAGSEVAPVAIKSNEVADANYHKYVSLTANFAATDEKNGVATDSEGTAAIYAQWNNAYSDPMVALPAEEGLYEIRGFVSSYKGNYQVLVCEFIDKNSVEGVALDQPIAIVGRDIIAPEGAEIYSIGGVRVNGENLATGVYVVRVAGKSFKVIVK